MGSATKLTGTSQMIFAYPSRESPGCTDIHLCIRVHAPVPKWLMPLSLLKRFVTDAVQTWVVDLHEKVQQKWDTHPYQGRIDGQTELYDQLVRLEHERSQEKLLQAQPL